MRALASEPTNQRQLRALQVEHGHSTDVGLLCTCTQTEGKGVSKTSRTFQKSQALGASNTNGDNGVARAPYIIYLYTQWKLGNDLGSIVHATAISRFHTGATQSQDCVN